MVRGSITICFVNRRLIRRSNGCFDKGVNLFLKYTNRSFGAMVVATDWTYMSNMDVLKELNTHAKPISPDLLLWPHLHKSKTQGEVKLGKVSEGLEYRLLPPYLSLYLSTSSCAIP